MHNNIHVCIDFKYEKHVTTNLIIMNLSDGIVRKWFACNLVLCLLQMLFSFVGYLICAIRKENSLVKWIEKNLYHNMLVYVIVFT